MKKAFEQNVSRAKPRLRLGAFTGAVDQTEPTEPPEQAADVAPPEPPSADLSSEVRARIERARAPRPTAAEAMEVALSQPEGPRAREPVFTQQVAEPVTYASPEPEAAVYDDEVSEAPVTYAAPPTVAFHLDGLEAGQSSEAHPMTQGSPHASLPHVTATVAEPVARVEAPPQEVEVQTPAPPREEAMDSDARRERLKARLKAVRENPRPEPLPATVAEAGQRAVERITHLQAELVKVKAANLSLTQELEVARRQAEKATEEARLRMDEARRLSSEMEGRVKLLADLERELAALEGERDEALLSLQENRQALQASAKEHEKLEEEVVRGKQALVDSLAEEERLATELESAKDESMSLRRAVEALQGERDVLAQQVASLTAERAELLEARKALEAVHRALSQAAAR
ncbi:extensin-like protein [Myxococcus sp. K38C18041901]|uniref:extensin-like protein n=1 Tax=Myxococcus guangdongensis TaxID=2906760 RepID=UPI0020A7DF18|nr:extensin-like protein [Myxococcus guangdongensis]MCP3064698.1 extensin-like protein [Myxococcus guangdongensis]